MVHTTRQSEDAVHSFYEHPILNNPYEYPNRHWQLDQGGRPTSRIVEARRSAKFVTPIPRPKAAQDVASQPDLGLEADDSGQAYDLTSIINRVRGSVDRWRLLPASERNVTPETGRLLHHWRHHSFGGIRPFFCQIEAVETTIWLTEVAPKTAEGKRLLDHLRRTNDEANPGLSRLALKLATGAGKTMVMAMIITWQTINAVRHPGSKTFTKGFLIVTPGITIRDRLRVLVPNDPDNYYVSRELVPTDLQRELNQARVVITNYHAFRLRETVSITKGTRALIAGRRGAEPRTAETEGGMIRRVLGNLMDLKGILVINDEAHHCYRAKPASPRRRRCVATASKRRKRTPTRRGCGSPESKR